MEEAQSAGKSELDRLRAYCARLAHDLNGAWERIRTLEARCEKLAASQSSVAAQPDVALSDVERRLCRMETKIAEVGQNGAEFREKVLRVTRKRLLCRYIAPPPWLGALFESKVH